jgi:cell wall assembly regulator SMI1
MDLLWQKIESWMSANAPNLLNGLNPPATEHEIDLTEIELSVKFPSDFRESYLVHNGGKPGGPFMFPGGEFLSLERIVEEWSVWKDLVDDGTFREDESEPDRGIHDDWYNIRWIPFTADGSGNHNCMDLAPSSWGTNGQIITMWHDAPERELLASGFRDYLELLLERLQSEEYIYSPEYDGVVPSDDIS